MRSLHSARSFSNYIDSDNSNKNAVSPALSNAVSKPQANQSVGSDQKQTPSASPTTTKKKIPIPIRPATKPKTEGNNTLTFPRSATDTVKQLDEKSQSDKTIAIDPMLQNHVEKREQNVPPVKSAITRSSSFSSYSSPQMESASTSSTPIDEVSKNGSINVHPRYRRAALFNQTAITNKSPSKSLQPSKIERLSDDVASQKDTPNKLVRRNSVNKTDSRKIEPSRKAEVTVAIESTTTIHPPKSPRSAYTRRAYATYATNSLTAELSCKLEKSTSSANLTQDKPAIVANTWTNTKTNHSTSRRQYTTSTFMNSVKSSETSAGLAQPHTNDNENSILQSASYLGPLHRRKISTSRPSSSKSKSTKTDQTENSIKKSDGDNSQTADTSKTNITVVRYRGAAALSETSLVPKAIKLSSDHKLRRKDEMDKSEHSRKLAVEKVLHDMETKLVTNQSIKLFSTVGTHPSGSNIDKKQNAVDTNKNKNSDGKTPDKTKRSIKYNVESGHSPAFLGKIYIAEPGLESPKRVRQHSVSLQSKSPSKSPSKSRPQRKSIGAMPSKTYHGTEHNRSKLDQAVALHRRQSFDSTFPSTSNHSSNSGIYDSLSKSSKHVAANISEWKTSPSLSSSRAKQYLGQPTPIRLANRNEPATPKQRYQQACLEHGYKNSPREIGMEPVSYTSLSTHCLSIVPCEQITSANAVPALSSEKRTKTTVQEMISPCLENPSNRRGLTVTVSDDQSQMFCDKPIAQSPVIQNEYIKMKSSMDLHTPISSLEQEPPVRRFFSQSQRQVDGKHTFGEFDDTGIVIKKRPSSNKAGNAAENRPGVRSRASTTDESAKSHNGNENNNYADIVMKALLDGQERMEFSSSLNMIAICGAPVSTEMEPRYGTDTKLDDCIPAEKLAGIGLVTDSTTGSKSTNNYLPDAHTIQENLMDVGVNPNDDFRLKKANQESKVTSNVENDMVDNGQKNQSSIPSSIGTSSMGSWSDSIMSSLPAVDDVFRVKMTADFVDHGALIVDDDDEDDQDFSTMIDQLENEEVHDYLQDLTLSSITMTNHSRRALKLHQDGKRRKGQKKSHEEKKKNFTFEDDKQTDENLNVVDGSATNIATEESVAVAATKTKTKVGGMISSLKNILKSGQRKEADIRNIDTNVIDCNSTISTKTTIDKNVYSKHCKERTTENMFDTVTVTSDEKSSPNRSNNRKVNNNHHHSMTTTTTTMATATLTASMHTRTTTGSKPASMMKRFLIIGKGPKG